MEQVEKAFFVNGRRVRADVLNFSLEEGWVEIEDLSVLPPAPTREIIDVDADVEKSMSSTEPVYFADVKIALPRKKLYGKVEIVERKRGT